MTKICSLCKIEKPLEEFHNSSKSKDGKKSSCKSCRNEDSRKWNSKNKQRKAETARWWSKKNKYGITKDDYISLLTKQQGCCAICNSKSEDNMHGHLYVDHCHKTGVVRGLLCYDCNTLLGMSKDSPEVLLSAINYLKEVNMEGSGIAINNEGDGYA